MTLVKDTVEYRCRSARRAADLSQREVAELLGMSQAGFSKLETLGRGLGVKKVKRLAEIYHVDVTWLLLGDLPGG